MLLLLTCHPECEGQKQANNWFFGVKQGVSFQSGKPEKLAGGQLNTLEGSAAISDEAGNLLFYTDGVTVWNRQHRIMYNGTGLKGHWSSTHSALIVPKPGNSDSYYIFTADEGGYINPPNDGIYYSEVSMCLDGGLGGIVEKTKNTLLLKPASEKLAAGKHANGVDYWVVMLDLSIDNFYAYRVTPAGLVPTPVKTFIPGRQKGPETRVGQMKISPDGKKLAVANQSNNFFEVFDFDTQTGIVSNPITLSGFSPLPPHFYHQGMYGLEFSPDGSKLYASRDPIIELLQYDLEAGNEAAVAASRVALVDSFTNNTFPAIWSQLRGMQLGPDKKIYIVNSTNTGYGLSVIEYPNIKGHGSTYRERAVWWEKNELPPHGMNEGFASLPSFVSSFFRAAPEIRFSYNCFSPGVTFSVGSPDGSLTTANVAAISWNFGEPAAGKGNISADKQPSHSYSAFGNFTVKAEVTWQDGLVQQLETTVPVQEAFFGGTAAGFGGNITLCRGEELLLDAAPLGDVIEWQDGSTGSTFRVTQSGIYRVTVCRQGCMGTETVEVVFDPCTSVPEVPNIFTPNRDGYNDKFVIRGIEVGKWELTVYNRYGVLVYRNEDYQNDWEGAALGAGVYYYLLRDTKSKRIYKGWLEIVR